MSKNRRPPSVELVVFTCPSYMVGKFHEGLFGSVTRFIPMSMKGKHFITDIDMKLRTIFLLSRVHSFVKERRGVDYLYVTTE